VRNKTSEKKWRKRKEEKRGDLRSSSTMPNSGTIAATGSAG
jgi:hypothetical protein